MLLFPCNFEFSCSGRASSTSFMGNSHLKKASPLHGRADFYEATIIKWWLDNGFVLWIIFCIFNTQSCLFVCEAGRYMMESSSLPLGAADLGIPCHMYLSMSLWMFTRDIPHRPRVGLNFAAFYRQCLFVCLFVCLFSHSRIFHLYGDVTLTGALIGTHSHWAVRVF